MLKLNFIHKVLLLIILVKFSTQAPKNSKHHFRNLYKNPIKNIDAKPNPKIISGHEATPHAYPYQAFLEIYSSDSGWYCGGSLISENYVLTAGHCGFGAAQAYIILGAHRPLDEDEYHFKVSSNSITVHELYDNENIVNDLAVIELSLSADISSRILPISLPDDAYNDYVDYLATSTGWGVTQAHEMTPSDALNYLQLSIIENEVCEIYFGSLQSSVICALDSVGNGNLCDGDSGGPLVTDGVLVGVASYGAPYCLGGYPTVFTRTSSFLDWIAENTDVEIRNH